MNGSAMPADNSATKSLIQSALFREITSIICLPQTISLFLQIEPSNETPLAQKAAPSFRLNPHFRFPFPTLSP